MGIEFDQWELPILNKNTFQSTNERVFFGGDSALGPDNIITAVAHGHDAALSIHLTCQNEDINDRPSPITNLSSQKMGIHQWSYDNDISNDVRYAVPHAQKEKTLNDLNLEVELGFDEQLAFNETMRCLNCDVQTVFTDKLCIECDACVDICPTDCITFTNNSDEQSLRGNLLAPAPNQDLFTYPTVSRQAESWLKMKIFACIVAYALSDAQPLRGICRSISLTQPRRSTRARISYDD